MILLDIPAYEGDKKMKHRVEVLEEKVMGSYNTVFMEQN